jgi:hypothetical protein
VDAQSQFHPVTVQWQMPDGKIGWIQLTRTPPIDASAKQGEIEITAAGDVSFRIYAPGVSTGQLQQKLWTLPGLKVRVTSDAKNFVAHGENALSDVTYTGMTHMILNIDHSASAHEREK